MSRLTPVVLPPGRFKLSTKPIFTGSPPVVNTIGIADVAALAASAEGSPPVVTNMAAPRWTRSKAIAGSRSYCPSAQRNSIATFFPSSYPVSPKPLRNAATRAVEFTRRPAAQIAYDRQTPLRVSRQRPARRHSARPPNKLAPSHPRLHEVHARSLAFRWRAATQKAVANDPNVRGNVRRRSGARRLATPGASLPETAKARRAPSDSSRLDKCHARRHFPTRWSARKAPLSASALPGKTHFS